MESRACKEAYNSVDALKILVKRKWAALPRDYVARTCQSFRHRVEAMLAADRGVFEKE